MVTKTALVRAPRFIDHSDYNYLNVVSHCQRNSSFVTELFSIGPFDGVVFNQPPIVERDDKVLKSPALFHFANCINSCQSSLLSSLAG